jgi:hypothetical protein
MVNDVCVIGIGPYVLIDVLINILKKYCVNLISPQLQVLQYDQKLVSVGT